MARRSKGNRRIEEKKKKRRKRLESKREHGFVGGDSLSYGLPGVEKMSEVLEEFVEFHLDQTENIDELRFGAADRWVSPIHVHDCARALVHLAEHGEPGGRYFLVNDDPVRMHDFAEVFARLARRPLHVWRVPAAAARLVVGSVLAECFRDDAVFSNIRLRGTGFRFRHSTLEQGLEQIVGALDG